jgi:hypothetical protein
VIVYSRALTSTLLALSVVGVLVISGTAWAAFDSAPYFPLSDGLTWTYQREIDQLTSTVIALPGTVVVGSTATKVLQASTEGSCSVSQTFNTSDGSGIRLHRLFTPNVPISNLGTRDVTITLNPPVVLANGMTDLGQSTGQQIGNAQVAISPPVFGSPFNFSYNASFTTAGAFATRTVPAGTFPDLLQLNGTIMITGLVLGQPVNLTLSFTFYLGQNIGVVESTTGIGANSGTIKLATVPPIPTHTLTVTCDPSGTPNSVGSGGTANLNVAAVDSLGHPLTYAWTADCPAALVGDGSFNNAALQTPTWTAPQNTTGSQQNCTIQVTVSDGQGLTQSPSYAQGVSSEGGPHTLTITSPPSGLPNPVASGGTADLSVAATDTLPHPLTYAWTADCPAALVGDGSFNNAALQTPTWTAPPNTTGSQQDCTIQVTVSDGAVPDPKSQSPTFSQGVSPEGVGPSEPTVPQLLNLKTFDGADSEQQTFLPTDPIHVAATYFDPNAACAGVAPVLLQLLFFNLDGQLLVTREDVTSAPIAPGSKYRLLSANLAPGDLVPGAYTLIFLVRDCTSVNIFVSGAYAIRVVTP